MKTGPKIGFDESARLGRLIDKEDKGGASAQGFDADGTGSGKKVEDIAALYPVSKDVEQGFTDPIAGRADESLSGSGRSQFTAARATSGDTQERNL